MLLANSHQGYEGYYLKLCWRSLSLARFKYFSLYHISGQWQSREERRSRFSPVFLFFSYQCYTVVDPVASQLGVSAHLTLAAKRIRSCRMEPKLISLVRHAALGSSSLNFNCKFAMPVSQGAKGPVKAFSQMYHCLS